MKGITVTLPDGRMVGLPVPKECNRHILLAAIRDLMRGLEPSKGLTAAEVKYLGDLHDEIQKAMTHPASAPANRPEQAHG